MILSLSLVTLACAMFLLGGYLLGVRRAIESRDALRADLARAEVARDGARADAQRFESSQTESTARAQRDAEALSASVARARQDAEALTAARRELERAQARVASMESEHSGALRDVFSLRERLAAAEAELAVARSQVQRVDAINAETQAELKRLASTLVQSRDTGRHEMKEVERILSPLLEGERVAQAIQHIDLGRGTREELPRILDAIAKAASLSTLVLSDDSGLPLVASTGSERTEVLAGVWSQLLILADRVVENGDPAPFGMRVLDVDGRVLAHRIFSAGDQRFLLTGVARAGGLSPEALEPAVAKLERVLMRDAWQV